MDSVKYIGMDAHKEASSVAVLNSSGKLLMECTIETKAGTILDFMKGLRGSLQVTFEEGTWAAWLYDLIKPNVTELVVCITERKARTILLKRGGLDGKRTSSHRRSVFFVDSFYRTKKISVRASSSLARTCSGDM
jgi:transposase